MTKLALFETGYRKQSAYEVRRASEADFCEAGAEPGLARIEGPGKERAKLAYACLAGDREGAAASAAES